MQVPLAVGPRALRVRVHDEQQRARNGRVRPVPRREDRREGAVDDLQDHRGERGRAGPVRLSREWESRSLDVQTFEWRKVLGLSAACTVQAGGER